MYRDISAKIATWWGLPPECVDGIQYILRSIAEDNKIPVYSSVWTMRKTQNIGLNKNNICFFTTPKNWQWILKEYIHDVEICRVYLLPVTTNPHHVHSFFWWFWDSTYPKNPDPSKVAIFEDPDPCYPGCLTLPQGFLGQTKHILLVPSQHPPIGRHKVWALQTLLLAQQYLRQRLVLSGGGGYLRRKLISNPSEICSDMVLLQLPLKNTNSHQQEVKWMCKPWPYIFWYLPSGTDFCHSLPGTIMATSCKLNKAKLRSEFLGP